MELASGERLAAEAVVVNADLPYAARALVAPRWRRGSRLSDEALERAAYSCSTFMLYLGLDRCWALPHHLIYLSRHARRTDPAALEDRVAELEDPPFYVCNPCGTDPSGAPRGHSTLYVLIPTPNTSRPVDWGRLERTLVEPPPTTSPGRRARGRFGTGPTCLLPSANVPRTGPVEQSNPGIHQGKPGGLPRPPYLDSAAASSTSSRSLRRSSAWARRISRRSSGLSP